MTNAVNLANLPIGGPTGGLQLPAGTTAQRPTTLTNGLMRFNTDLGAQEIYSSTTGWASLGARDGSSAGRAALKSTDIKLLNPSAPTGWYWLQINGIATQVYVDMDYDGGGWVLVGTHPRNVIIPALTYAQTTTGLVQLGNSGFVVGSTDPKQYATWSPLARWRFITLANGSGNNVAYFVAGSQVELGATGSHSRRSRWTWGGWTAAYAWSGAANLVNEVGGVTPGLWSYHISNAYNWTTVDVDQDASGANCSTSFNNSPWWYGACWDGSFWGDNGAGNYTNAVHWTSSGADNYNYGAIYVK